MRRISILTFAFGISAAMAGTAFAQVGISARTAGMGGVGVAVARGGEGLYYNPAVMASVESAEVGLSASAYGFETRTYSDYFLITDDGGNAESVDLSIRSISSFPSAASTVLPFEDFAIGFGIFIPQGGKLESSVLFDPNLYPLAREGQLKEESTEYWLTGGGAMDFGALSLGLGIILQLTDSKLLNSVSFFEAGPTIGSPTILANLQSVESIALDLRAQLGLHLDLDVISLGLAVLSPTANLGGTASFRSNETFSDADEGTSLTTTVVENAGSNNAKPLQVSAGAALNLPGFMVTADAALTLPRSYRPFILDEGIEATEEPLSLRVALGGSVDINDDLAFRAGFFAVPLAEKLATEEELQQVNVLLVSMNPDERNRGFDQAFALVDQTDVREYGLSLGASYARGGGRADVALTGVLATGNHVTYADHVRADGELETSLVKRSVRGFAVLISIGGTYGFSEEEQKKESDQ